MKRITEYLRQIIGRFFRSNPKETFTDSNPRSSSSESSVTIELSTADSDGVPFRQLAMPSEPLECRPRKILDSAAAFTQWDLSAFQVPIQAGRTRFHDLGLPEKVMHGIAGMGFQYCTPIQAEMMPAALTGRDAFGRAQTGTGKTAAFLITILARFHADPVRGKPKPGTPRALVLAPTRELVMQIVAEAEALAKHSSFRIAAVFGGMDYEKQRRQLTGNAVDLVIATPGRLLDFQRKRQIHLNQIEILIIDEADRMLDMGFIPDVSRIIACTPQKSKRQTMLFSATLTPEVRRLSAQWTQNPLSVEIEPEQVAADTVEQIVYITTADEKFALLFNYITQKDLQRVIVFCNRKDETRRLAQKFIQYRINCALLSGDVPQQLRVRTLEDFKEGKIRVLVATDVAGRGIHIDGMSHVINYTLPHDPEDYVHRIGRTGRAGANGTSVSFACEEDSFYIPAIEEYMGRGLVCIRPTEELLAPLVMPPAQKKRTRPRHPQTNSDRAGKGPVHPGGKPHSHHRRKSRSGYSGAFKSKRPEELVSR